MSPRREEFRLPKELQLAAAAAGLLVLSFILPWYQKSVAENSQFVQSNVSALGAFTFVEAAILLVAVAIGFLVYARLRKRGFHLPGGDGVAIVLAGGWAMLLLVYRLFDKPDIEGVGATMGIQWGIFGAMAAAGLLIAAGLRVKAIDAPEPPNPAADDAGWVAPPRRERPRTPDRKPRDATAVTEFLRDRPSWEGDIGDAPTTRLGDERTTRLDDAPTTRLPEDPSEAPTRRERRPEVTERLWEDETEH
ncbi:hypothetical protein DVA67_019875 [Solirubrobacter sp. CPCC 204708]|uniref:Uncharacterized protein n=1 Tax=Solirubrobacter deserti TaxID=2282478 RepID=A0ABT4RPU3_9ACTN|nr:hypothetical protein [Solirubrobacter deserti]MBE2318251.1 hypothetical protein [Solirubrobacter deserti]MDA0140589.1 hypothetical protein [Solirubrobacter deserti]